MGQWEWQQGRDLEKDLEGGSDNKHRLSRPPVFLSLVCHPLAILLSFNNLLKMFRMGCKRTSQGRGGEGEGANNINPNQNPYILGDEQILL